MISIQRQHVDQLIAVEAHVHYGVPPPSGRAPFVAVRRTSSVLFSAPHGAITYRNSHREMWHDEDDYTAGMALLLAELCGTAAIATIWRTDGEDPNYHLEASSAYKRALGRLVAECGVRWVIDLHGARDASMPRHQLVDLGTRRDRQSLSPDLLARLEGRIEDRLGPGTVSHNVFPARVRNRTIAAFCQDTLGISSVQVEMKSAVRAPQRRVDATAFAKEGPYSAPPERVVGMLQALADFVADLDQAAG
jgi:hypothetical protein